MQDDFEPGAEMREQILESQADHEERDIRVQAAVHALAHIADGDPAHLFPFHSRAPSFLYFKTPLSGRFFVQVDRNTGALHVSDNTDDDCWDVGDSIISFPAPENLVRAKYVGYFLSFNTEE